MEDSAPDRREANRGRLLAQMPKGAVCAEIGVWEGKFSARILAETQAATLHLIDPWQYMPQFSDTGFGRKKNADLMEVKYQEVVKAYGADPRVVIHRATSEEALSALLDHSLDWVYIDGNHHEAFVKRDLELSLQKVKPDGIIAGDDYNWKVAELGGPVKRAVSAVMQDLGRQAELTVSANQYIIRLKRSAG